MPAPDTRQSIFDPGMDVATVVFSHVRCVQTRVNLTLVSKLWRDASKTAAAYPLVFDFDAFSRMPSCHMTPERTRVIIDMMDNDEALSLPYERVVGLLGEAAKNVCDDAAMRGSVRLLKWMRENNLDWSTDTCYYAAANGHLPALKYLHENGSPWGSHTCLNAAINGHLPVLQYLHENGCHWDSDTSWYAAANGHLPALKYLHENGCPWGWETCHCAARNKHWDCLQYAVDNKCPQWRRYADKHAEHLR